MKFRTILTYSVLIAILAIGILWRIQDKRAVAGDLQKANAARKGATPAVVLATAGPKRLVQSLEAGGTLESPSVAKVSSKVAGRIAYLIVREGTAVKRGDVLIRIDPGELQAAVHQQEAAVAEARARLAQAKATGALRRGSRVLLGAFGAGLSWGATVIEWGGEVSVGV